MAAGQGFKGDGVGCALPETEYRGVGSSGLLDLASELDRALVTRDRVFLARHLVEKARCGVIYVGEPVRRESIYRLAQNIMAALESREGEAGGYSDQRGDRDVSSRLTAKYCSHDSWLLMTYKYATDILGYALTVSFSRRFINGVRRIKSASLSSSLDPSALRPR